MPGSPKNKADAYVPRPDLRESLERSHIDPAKLSILQRILLTTDGTLTEILEAYLSEKIGLVKLSETIEPVKRDILPLEITSGQEVMQRKILLQGKISRNNWIYADSSTLESSRG